MATQPVRSADDHDNPSSSGEGSSDPGQGELNPMEGGRWRPVRPDELLRKNHQVADRTKAEDPEAEPKPKVRLERRQELEHHLRSSPTDLDGYMELAAIYRSEQRPLEARRILQQAMLTFPDELNLRWEHEEATLARSLQQLREVSDLAQRLDTAETTKELRRSQDDWACRRMDVCRARLKRDPSLVQLRVVLGEAMYDAKLYEPALDAMEIPVSNDELAPHAHLIRSRCLLALGRDVEALASLRASSLRRAVVAPLKTKVMALRLLCETAERLGVELTLDHYRQHLQHAEKELANQTPVPDAGSDAKA